MKMTATLFATTLILGTGLATLVPVTEAEAASKRTGCVTNATNTNQNACDTHVKCKRPSTIPTTHRNNTRRFNFGSEASLSHADSRDPGGGGGAGGGQR